MAISLYKHRVSMPRAGGDHLGYDMLAPFTLERAVARQLLSLRSNGAGSRFTVLPSRPDAHRGYAEGRADAESIPSCLELRVLAAEVLVLGPAAAQGRGAGAGQVQNDGMNDDISPRVAPSVVRAMKVCYQYCACTEPDPCSSTLVVPQPEFGAVASSLELWSRILPASVRDASPFGKKAGSSWHTSFLPLPPCDSGVE